MKPDISEFSYGYAATEELVTAHKALVVGAPTFPSLYEEGTKGGYDVQIPLTGSPVFLQFKLADFLSKKSAKEFKSGLMDLPYYRMHLRPLKHSNQHKLLLDLEAEGEMVFYIAPRFHLPHDLNFHYLSRTVINHSAAFRPADIGELPDGDEHYVIFAKSSDIAYRCSSQPKKIVPFDLQQWVRAVSSVASKRLFGQQGLSNLLLKMSKVVETEYNTRRGIGDDPRLDAVSTRRILEERSPFEAAAYLARSIYGCELLIVR